MDQHDGLARAVVLIVELDITAVLCTYGDESHRGQIPFETDQSGRQSAMPVHSYSRRAGFRGAAL